MLIYLVFSDLVEHSYFATGFYQKLLWNDLSLPNDIFAMPIMVDGTCPEDIPQNASAEGRFSTHGVLAPFT